MTTSPTNNKPFDENGFLIVRNICDPSDLEQLISKDIPKERGKVAYYGSVDKFDICPNEQVPGSLARYRYPTYKDLHTKIRKKLESIIGKQLYNTYYYDRFYFPGQPLTKHTDRDSCEISVTIHISTNLKKPWAFYVSSPDNTSHKVFLNPGDGVIYKGCERPHWRDPMPGRKRNLIRRLFGIKQLYYHQIFFHYVLANGERAHCANDSGLT
jgi:hypothetical protein